MTDMLDDDLAMEAWMQMTEAEQDAELDRTMREYSEWWDSLTPIQQYRSSRRRNVELCLSWRRHLRAFDLDILRDHLRGAQIRLLKLRIERSTGIYPGSA